MGMVLGGRGQAQHMAQCHVVGVLKTALLRCGHWQSGGAVFGQV